MQVAVIRSRTGWAILAASEVWLDGDDPIAGYFASARGDRWRLAARGWSLMLVYVVLVFVCFGVGGSLAGIF